MIRITNDEEPIEIPSTLTVDEYSKEHQTWFELPKVETIENEIIYLR